MAIIPLRRVGRAAVAPPAFNPFAVPGLKAWWDSDTLGGLADGDAISTWTDRTPNAYAVTQAAAKRPLYKTNIIANRPVVRFDATDDILVRSGAPPFTGTAGAIFIVAASSNVTSGLLFGSGDEAAAAERFDIDFAAGSHIALVYQKSGGALFLGTGDTTLSTGVPYVYSFLSDGSTYTAFVNGVAQTLTVGSGSNNGDWWGDTAGLLDNISIGGLKTNAEFSGGGDIAAVLVYDSVTLSADSRRYIERSLGRRYGITVS